MNNLQAFLSTISFSEGTFGKGDNGYNVLVGGELFEGYLDHPRQKVFMPKLGIFSTAAGRYQILERIYDAYKVMLQLEDFSPTAQDAIASRMLAERGALTLIAQGNFDSAALRAATGWASFPGAGYSQHENKLSDLRDFYVKQGGTLCLESTQLSS